LIGRRLAWRDTMALQAAVLLMIFNRPRTTERVFRVISEVKPRKLLIAADGPRGPAEAALCEETRRVVDKVDWDCEVLRDYSPVNLGCARRGHSAFTWVFSHVDEAILLEDDTLPHPSFFRFCEGLLERYRHDERVMHISGDNFRVGVPPPYSYFFSKYALSWGWATWRRAWRHYDFGMKAWPEFKVSGLMESICDDPFERRYFTDVFDRVHADPVAYNTYSTQWMFACWSQGGLAIQPAANLVSNIGFGDGATHTLGDAEWANLPVADIGVLDHPPFVGRDHAADRYTFDRHFYGRYLRQSTMKRELIRRTPAVVRRLYRRLFPRQE
jgi:hypothetical protein